MEPLTTVVLSGILYDMLKHSVSVTSQNLKARFQAWILDEAQSEKLSSAINHLNLNDEMSETAINKQLMSSHEIVALLNEIQPNNSTIIQTHSGNGDNIAGNKITYN